jgi:3-oxoacyl-[acyl-carrier-protein] synthase II
MQPKRKNKRLACFWVRAAVAFPMLKATFARWFGASDGLISPYAISSAIAGMVSSEISIAFGLRGRSHTVSDGCTSASDAFGYALDAIRSGRAETLLCGGADAPITPGTLAAFALMRAVPTRFNDAPQHASRPFDQNRDGFVLGEGAWIFVLESEESAQARGAKIWAEIAGYGTTCEAYHRVALSEPDEGARAMKMAMQDAQIAPQNVDYVNLHGTATGLNDPLETAAVKMALGDHAFSTPMSATKSQIGHPQGASGAAGVAAALVAMHEGFIAPTINLENPAPDCDLDYTPNVGARSESRSRAVQLLGIRLEKRGCGFEENKLTKESQRRGEKGGFPKKSLQKLCVSVVNFLFPKPARCVISLCKEQR